MKLYTIKDETNLLTEVQYLARVREWRNKSISRLEETKETLREIKKFYIDEGICTIKPTGIFGDHFRFTTSNEKAPLANATMWPYEISRESDCIVCAGDTEEDARARLTRHIDRFITEIDVEIEDWGKKFPDHKEFTFDESILTKQDEAYSSLEGLEEDMRNH